MRLTGEGEKGSLPGSWLTFLVVVLALGAVVLLIRRYLGAPTKPPGPGPSPIATPTAPSKSDSAQATNQLLQALNQRLQDLDLLKLLSKDVVVRPVTVQGQPVLTYHEDFRLPLRYSADQIAGQLEGTAKSLGARMELSLTSKGTCSFSFDPQWVPVEITFERVRKPRVCLIIDDGGYQKGETLGHLYGFKVPVTVAIIPDVEFSKDLAEDLPKHGVEVMCHMPMEGHEKGMVGGAYKELLKKGMGDSQVKAAVEEALDGLPNCRGLNNHMGSVATTDPELIWEVCQVLKTRGLFIIDSRTTAQSIVEPVANKAQVPVAHRDVFLDNVETQGAILKQLGQLVDRARTHGLAVGIGHFKLTTLKTLEEAVHQLRNQGIQFVYASEVVKEE